MLRRELSTQQPFHSTIAAACLVSKLPSDVTSPEGNNSKNLVRFVEKDTNVAVLCVWASLGCGLDHVDVASPELGCGKIHDYYLHRLLLEVWLRYLEGR